MTWCWSAQWWFEKWVGQLLENSALTCWANPDSQAYQAGNHWCSSDFHWRWERPTKSRCLNNSRQHRPPGSALLWQQNETGYAYLQEKYQPIGIYIFYLSFKGFTVVADCGGFDVRPIMVFPIMVLWFKRLDCQQAALLAGHLSSGLVWRIVLGLSWFGFGCLGCRRRCSFLGLGLRGFRLFRRRR